MDFDINILIVHDDESMLKRLGKLAKHVGQEFGLTDVTLCQTRNSGLNAIKSPGNEFHMVIADLFLTTEPPDIDYNADGFDVLEEAKESQNGAYRLLVSEQFSPEWTGWKKSDGPEKFVSLQFSNETYRKQLHDVMQNVFEKLATKV